MVAECEAVQTNTFNDLLALENTLEVDRVQPTAELKRVARVPVTGLQGHWQ